MAAAMETIHRERHYKVSSNEWVDPHNYSQISKKTKKMDIREIDSVLSLSHWQALVLSRGFIVFRGKWFFSFPSVNGVCQSQ